MTLLQRLKDSYQVQEQEAAERLEELENTLRVIKMLAECTLFNNNECIVEEVNKVLEKDYE